jgi:hypothetical protein
MATSTTPARATTGLATFACLPLLLQPRLRFFVASAGPPE